MKWTDLQSVSTQGLFKYLLCACSNMSSLRFSCKTLVVLTLFTSSFSPLIVADNIHRAEKRQIGVLARTGALPQGKRSVEVLARNGELPHAGSKKDTSEEDTEDSLAEELQRAENLSILRVQALIDKLFRQGEPSEYATAKRSLAALARNGELPQKRLSETLARSGYLIKPSVETARTPLELLASDDFLVDAQPSVIPELLNEGRFRPFLSTVKRNLGSAKNFLLDSGKPSSSKRNLGSLARDGSFHSARYPLVKNRKIRDSFDWADMQDDYKRSLSASRSFNDLDISANCCDQYPYQMTESVDKADAERRKRADTDYEDILPEVYAEGNTLEKRFLGRIPQLGRIHQKSQSPSSRRRPHLRPNWL